ncbi:calcium-dependent lipid-binding (CaLB domain) family protein [Actinidia rufa]|uniref:Calcium-dependent lipid-binding (CaLB domain) family protein n=1 Tax=Actinidia rufa TaxID=165716 RepID=A0A7J0DAW4_9ERIC|nr:calcium-dependent lipid-binding (CaLB domain) family protein [Actinidia rufa]
MEGARGAADLEREKPCVGGGRRREESGDEAVGSADGNVAEPRDVEDEDLDAEGGGEEVVVDREDEAVVDGGGEFVLRVDPRHRVGAEEFGDGGQVLGR